MRCHDCHPEQKEEEKDIISWDNDNIDGCRTVRIAAIVANAISDVVASNTRGGSEHRVGQRESPKHDRKPPLHVGGLCQQLTVLANLLLGRNGVAKLNGVQARQRI